jgi:hypothetical protein
VPESLYPLPSISSLEKTKEAMMQKVNVSKTKMDKMRRRKSYHAFVV